MALIQNIGRAGKVVYGSGMSYTFRVKFTTQFISTPTGIIRQYDQPVVFDTTTNAVGAGTLIVAGTTVTLTSTDILTPTGVATKIAGTAIAGYTVYSIRDQVTLVNTTLGPATRPTLAIGTATNIQFGEAQWTDGAVVPANGDDIFIGGRTPVTITLTSVGGSGPVVGASVGTLQDQIAGTLTYVTQTLTGGTITLMAPWNFIKITNFNSATSATLYITR